MTLGQQGRRPNRTQDREGDRIRPSGSGFSELTCLPSDFLQHRLSVHQYQPPRGELPCWCDKARQDTGGSNYLLPSRKHQLSRTHPLWNQWALTTNSWNQRERHRNEGKRSVGDPQTVTLLLAFPSHLGPPGPTHPSSPLHIFAPTLFCQKSANPIEGWIVKSDSRESQLLLNTKLLYYVKGYT